MSVDSNPKKNRPKAVMMLSGGLDSTVAAFVAARDYEPVIAITFDYGQKARRREMGAAYGIASALGIPHRTIFVPFFKELSSSSLTLMEEELPEPSRQELDDPTAAAESAKSVWVPNRNGIFIAIGAGWAEKYGADVLVVGFNSEEAATFPDNSEEFVARQNEALAFSTSNKVKVLAPTGGWRKADIVRCAKEQDLALELVWSCYEGDSKPCMRCESCMRFERALDEADAREWLEGRLKGIR